MAEGEASAEKAEVCGGGVGIGAERGFVDGVEHQRREPLRRRRGLRHQRKRARQCPGAQGMHGRVIGQHIARLRPQLNQITGLRVFLNPIQDLRMGGRSSNSTYQYTLKSDNLADLKQWATRLTENLKDQPLLQDVDTDRPKTVWKPLCRSTALVHRDWA